MKKILFITLTALLLFSCKEDDVLVPTSFHIDENPINIAANGETKVLEVKTNASDVSLVPSEAQWCKITFEGGKLTVVAESNNSLAARETSIELVASDRKLPITITQAGQPTIRLEVTGAEASSFQEGEGIDKSFDNNYTTIYHSSWSKLDDQYELIYYLKDAPSVALISYHPRPNGGNGTFGNIEIFASSIDSPDSFIKIMDYPCDPKAKSVTHIEFPDFFIKPHAVKIIVDGSTSQGGFAACSEMEFYGVE